MIIKEIKKKNSFNESTKQHWMSIKVFNAKHVKLYLLFLTDSKLYNIYYIKKKEALLSVTMAKYLRHKEYEDVISSF